MGNFIENAISSIINECNGELTNTQKSYIDTIRSGDEKKGVELATNICRSMGLSPEEAYRRAKLFFHI